MDELAAHIRKVASAGGRGRAKALTKARLSEIATAAAMARNKKNGVCDCGGCDDCVRRALRRAKRRASAGSTAVSTSTAPSS